MCRIFFSYAKAGCDDVFHDNKFLTWTQLLRHLYLDKDAISDEAITRWLKSGESHDLLNVLRSNPIYQQIIKDALSKLGLLPLEERLKIGVQYQTWKAIKNNHHLQKIENQHQTKTIVSPIIESTINTGKTRFDFLVRSPKFKLDDDAIQLIHGFPRRFEMFSRKKLLSAKFGSSNAYLGETKPFGNIGAIDSVTDAEIFKYNKELYLATVRLFYHAESDKSGFNKTLNFEIRKEDEDPKVIHQEVSLPSDNYYNHSIESFKIKQNKGIAILSAANRPTQKIVITFDLASKETRVLPLNPSTTVSGVFETHGTLAIGAANLIPQVDGSTRLKFSLLFPFQEKKSLLLGEIPKHGLQNFDHYDQLQIRKDRKGNIYLLAYMNFSDMGHHVLGYKLSLNNTHSVIGNPKPIFIFLEDQEDSALNSLRYVENFHFQNEDYLVIFNNQNELSILNVTKNIYIGTWKINIKGFAVAFRIEEKEDKIMLYILSSHESHIQPEIGISLVHRIH